MGISVFPPASTGAVNKVYKEQYFRADGTWTYSASSNFNGEVEVTVVAGGGASGTSVNRASLGTNVFMSGAGGGGQVLSKCQFNVLNLGNQTVRIGAGGGGLSTAGGLFGGFSSFGNADAANLWTDPALADGMLTNSNATGTTAVYDTINSSGHANQIGYTSSITYISGTNPPLPPVGRTFMAFNVGQNSPITAEYFRCEPSTSYKIGTNYHRNSTTGVVVSSSVFWYTETGEQINSASLTSYTTLGTTGTWDEVVSTVSSPANARYGRLMWVCPSHSANFRMTGVFVTKASSGITTVKSGYSPGFKWSGQPNSSFTVAENANLLIAQGGGGGWGVGTTISDDGNMRAIPGQPGFTSGGTHIFINSGMTNAFEHHISGHGGGSGGSARQPEIHSSIATDGNSQSFTITSTNDGMATVDDSNGVRQWSLIKRISVSGGVGGNGMSVFSPASGPVTPYPFAHHGGPGEGIEGYGIGGFGYFASGTTNAGQRTLNPVGSKQYNISRDTGYGSSSSQNSSVTYYNDGLENSGNGGNGYRRNLSNGTNVDGNRGGSGIVIVRWYE